MNERRVGVFGATSLVGQFLLPLLCQAGWRVLAFSRHPVREPMACVEWRLIFPHPNPLPGGEGIKEDALSKRREAKDTVSLPQDVRGIEYWICVAPIWVLPDYFELLKSYGARRVVVLSSTSRFTKGDSTDREEQAVAQRLAESEARMQAWAAENGIEYVILRPTLIYGRGRDKNISEIARFIRRFRFFPLFGRATGLRQPVHAEDVAAASLAALETQGVSSRAYNLSGGETLPYREMVNRIFAALGYRPALFSVPLWLFAVAVKALRVFPRYRHWSLAMAERMNRDLVFDHAEAARDLGYSPRPFRLAAEDLPP